MAGHMTEEEYAAFKKKTGHREGQKVTTYYSENKKEAEGLKHHEERVEKNRKLRSQQISTTDRLKRAIGGKGTSDQNIKTNYKPTKSEKKQPAAPSTGSKVMGFLKERAIGIAHEMREPEPGSRRRGGGGAGGMMMAPPKDPFGVGGFGGGGGLHGMMGADPFREFPPRRAPSQDAPRKKRRKRQTVHREPRRGGMDMMGIPDSMKWMF
jgi:hypothetical protein